MQRYIVQNIKLPFEVSEDVVFAQAKRRLLKFFGNSEISSLEICKRSVDARRRDDIKFVWSISAAVNSKREVAQDKLALSDIVRTKDPTLNIIMGTEQLRARPLVVGFGPCGMFCALILAQNGYRPIVIERGSDIEKRAFDVEKFIKSGVLDTESNIQFGAGGAGTFSDGKLVTRINDEKCAVVIETMHKFGAPDDILFKAKPHIGTDYLKIIVKNIEKEIISLGGEVIYNTKFSGINSKGGKIISAKTNRGEIPCGAVVLAVGHSARDTFSDIERDGVILTPKAFSVGVRIEHLQSEIDRILYGKNAGNPLLPKGEYSLSHKCKDGRGVYTFCMCPGGEVVAAASEIGGIVTNGMSNHSRNGKNANSAIAVSVLPEDYGGTVDQAIDFQRKIERAAFDASRGSYYAPSLTLGDFMSDSAGSDFTDVLPTYMGGKVTNTNFHGVLPEFVISSLKEGLLDFDKKLPGFASPSAVLTAPETRTSSPVRIARDHEYIAGGFDNLYPCGEGAGYAGGITSAGVDGINCALKIMERYQRPN